MKALKNQSSLRDTLGGEMLEVATVFADTRQIHLSTTGRLAGVGSAFFKNIQDHQTPDFKIGTYTAVMTYFAKNWPLGAKWPKGIKRPVV